MDLIFLEWFCIVGHVRYVSALLALVLGCDGMIFGETEA